MSSFNIFDIIVTLCGLYMAYSGVMMKAKGKINTGLVLSRNVTPDQIKDKEGYIKFMWSKLVIIGILVAASGIFNMSIVAIAGQTETVVIIELIVNAIFFVMLVVYGLIIAKAQKEYIRKY